MAKLGKNLGQKGQNRLLKNAQIWPLDKIENAQIWAKT